MTACFWGTHYAFGVFLKPLVAEFGWSRAVTAGAFSVVMIVYGLSSIAMGRLSDRYGARVAIFCGGFLIGLGCFLSFWIHSVWQFYVFYGLIVGMGMGAAYVPMMSVVSRWFVLRRGLAIGIVVAGIGVGTLVLSPLCQFFISSYGWRNSYRIIGVADWFIIFSAAFFLVADPKRKGQRPDGHLVGNGEPNPLEHAMGERTRPAQGMSFSDARKTSSFWIFLVINFLWYIDLYMVLVHMVANATDKGIPPGTAANALAVLGACSIIGKVALGRVSDHIGGRPAIAAGFFLQVVATVLLLLADRPSMMYVFAAVFGLSYGGVTPQQAKITGELFGISSMGSILGAVVFAGSIGGAAGPLLGGYVYDRVGSYYLSFVLAAFALILAFGLTFLLRKPADLSGP